MTRRLNHPELIFNQRLKNDTTNNRFFKKDAGAAWQLSAKNQCYVCEKYRYTMIFYDRYMFSHNNGLVEIKDKELIKQLKLDHNFNYGKYKSMTPIICGTITNKAYNQKLFQRKLKMLRAPLFSLLQIC